MVLDWYSVTFEALQGLWQGFVIFIPKLVGAIIIFIIGWFIAIAVGKLISEILKRIKFNQIFERGVWKEALEKAEFKIDASGFIGAICKWILVIVFLLVAVEILGLVQFADFLVKVLAYLPNVVVAALIFVVAVIIADILEKVVRALVEGVRVGYGQVVGAIVRWSIWIFAILAILIQLKITPALLQTLFIGFVALIAIAGGIAFGLGGKEAAAELLQDFKKKLKG
ncbi:hypothetical protein COY31_01080 [Candidatus Wolfebacteria bacterium CG_4_10_14_0_2_um_filter_39_18]|uniref:Small-conductance mechanosensitive ion channel n=1 Tax=Candidatus Wolfebacteria bacterium CG_4_10_14_0_2_um_filter_39_18 TaxID=1975061 RepID=A0A2M7TGE0_9BACT|nr:MAG: hypothetical protein COY31_01080 [Candidatus Wolfebacteria bacterium CG_4_10_14_0_2_um_filter_39_18]